MVILPEPLEFERDKGNIDKNLKKHKLSNKEIEQTFINDKEKIIFDDQKHSETEKRHGIFGKTDNGKLLSIVFTLRKGTVMVITARSMSKRERRSYEKIKTDSKV